MQFRGFLIARACVCVCVGLVFVFAVCPSFHRPGPGPHFGTRPTSVRPNFFVSHVFFLLRSRSGRFEQVEIVGNRVVGGPTRCLRRTSAPPSRPPAYQLFALY
jgi:hypothetical protein